MGPVASTGAQAEPLKVFISYSRQDIAFAMEISSGLQTFGGFEISIDTESIHEGEDWRARLSSLIASADTVVFILTPNSASSPVCKWEVEEAVRLSKRILPVQAEGLGGIRPPVELSQLNYVRFDPQDDGRPRSFMHGLVALRRALTVDIVWLREHTRLLVRAGEWERAGKPEARLLSGSDIPAAKAWLAGRPADAPPATDLHHEFILASEVAEEARSNAERKRLDEMAAAQSERKKALDEAELATREKAAASSRLVRRTLAGLVVSLAFAVAASGAWYYAYTQRLVADAQRAAAKEAQVVAQNEAGEARAARARAEDLVKLVVRNLDTGWPDDDERSPDYRHLRDAAGSRDLVGEPFKLDARSVEALLAVNQFQPQAYESKVVLALRGALLEEFVIDKPEIILTETRPDHLTLRSVFVILDRRSQTLSAFPGSTVPNQRFMRNYFDDYLKGTEGVIRANLMPTGSYPYRLGAHGGGRVVPALRLTSATNPLEDGDIWVRRTLNDLVYDVDDVWDLLAPYNNLHVSYAHDESFSAAGSLTIRGTMGVDATLGERKLTGKSTVNRPAGDYAAFFKKLGAMELNSRVDIVLLTGLDAAIVSTAVKSRDGNAVKALRRLRTGSRGPLVEKLQRHLGIETSGRFGNETTRKLVELQKAKLDLSDGIYSPEMESLLGFGVFAEPSRPQ